MRILLTAVFLLLNWSGYAADGKYVNEEYDLQKVADGVYSFIAPESDSGVVQSNCTVIIGDNAVMVVDTGQFPSLAERMVADVRKLTEHTGALHREYALAFRSLLGECGVSGCLSRSGNHQYGIYAGDD